MKTLLAIIIACFISSSFSVFAESETNTSDARKFCDEFVKLIFRNPESAYDMFSDDYKISTDKQAFIKTISYILPPANTVKDIKFTKAEHGFENIAPDGTKTKSSEYIYMITTSDKESPVINIGVDVRKKGTTFYIIRIFLN